MPAGPRSGLDALPLMLVVDGGPGDATDAVRDLENAVDLPVAARMGEQLPDVPAVGNADATRHATVAPCWSLARARRAVRWRRSVVSDGNPWRW